MFRMFRQMLDGDSDMYLSKDMNPVKITRNNAAAAAAAVKVAFKIPELVSHFSQTM